jgi:hypothetical protein
MCTLRRARDARPKKACGRFQIVVVKEALQFRPIAFRASQVSSRMLFPHARIEPLEQRLVLLILGDLSLIAKRLDSCRLVVELELVEGIIGRGNEPGEKELKMV